MYEQLFDADLVIADISTANRNVFYELGVRHALRPHTTIVIAEDGIKPPFPFDVNHVAIRQYHHLGEDIGYSETMEFRAKLTAAIKQILPLNKIDSPVHEFLRDLAVTRAGASAPSGAGPSPGARAAEPGVPTEGETHRKLMDKVDRAQAAGEFGTAKILLEQIVADMTKSTGTPSPSLVDPYIIQRLALVTYKSEQPSKVEALERARELLETLQPHTSNDTETLGLWGAVHKRLWDQSKAPAHLDAAIRGYERGFYLRNDYYNGINLAYLLNLRASLATSSAGAVADFVGASRVRREVLAICDAWPQSNPSPPDSVTVKAMKEYLAARYWVDATRAEALLSIGDPGADAAYAAAYALDVPDWMKNSTREQQVRLQPMLADSPLKHLRE